MRRHVERYSVEVGLALLGAVAAALEAILTDRTDLALLTLMYSFLLALSVAAIRHDIVVHVGQVSAERQILESIPDPHWREEAQGELDRRRLEYARWADGVRRVSEDSSLAFQVRALQAATVSIRAVHVAMNRSSLEMWDNPHRGYDRMVDAYRALPDGLSKRRVLVLNRNDDSLSTPYEGGRRIVDDLAARVCRLQAAPRDKGGLGFDLRVLWLSTTDNVPPNLLIVDDREACSIENRGEDKYTDLEVVVNPMLVSHEMRLFEDLWMNATPVQHCLAPEGLDEDSTPT